MVTAGVLMKLCFLGLNICKQLQNLKNKNKNKKYKITIFLIWSKFTLDLLWRLSIVLRDLPRHFPNHFELGNQFFGDSLNRRLRGSAAAARAHPDAQPDMGRRHRDKLRTGLPTSGKYLKQLSCRWCHSRTTAAVLNYSDCHRTTEIRISPLVPVLMSASYPRTETRVHDNE